MIIDEQYALIRAYYNLYNIYINLIKSSFYRQIFVYNHALKEMYY